MATEIAVYIHDDDVALKDRIANEYPEAPMLKVRPLGAELDYTVAIIHLTAAGIHLLCTIADAFKHTRKSYIIIDKKQMSMEEVTPNIVSTSDVNASKQSDE